MRWGRRQRSHQCSRIADRLVIPQPFTLDAFCSGIAEQRGRPLLLVPLEGPPDPQLPCGMWLGLDTADLVFYDAGAADILRVQIILHEVAHMLLGHVAPEFAGPQEPGGDGGLPPVAEHVERLLARSGGRLGEIDSGGLPVFEVIRAEAARLRARAAASAAGDGELGLSADRIVHLLGRTKFASRQEKDAETLATLILERASRTEAHSTSDAAAAVLSRLNDVFGHPGRGK